MAVKPWRTDRPQAGYGAWHRHRLPALHPGGRWCGLADLDGLAWAEWRSAGGLRRVVALVEVAPLGAPVARAIEDRLPGLEALVDLGRRAGVPVYLVQHDPAFRRFRVHPLVGPPVRAGAPVVDGGEAEYAAWLVHLQAAGPLPGPAR